MFRSKSRTRLTSIVGIITVLMLALAACSPNALASQSTATAAATTAPAATNTTAATTAAAGSISIKASTNATLGSFLVDQNGKTLYLWKNDTAGTSNCTGACLQTWPAVLTNSTPTTTDTSVIGQLGVITRSDGTGQQATYNGIPLYYYSKDTAAGDTNGEGVGNKWYIVAPSTAPVTTTASLKVSSNTTLGNILVDQNGMTLYAYTKDTSGKTTCLGGCLAIWPAFLTAAAPTTSDSSITGTLGTLTRPDGSQQVTYNGIPLYFFTKDKAAGDTNGQGVGSVWFVVTPSGALSTQIVATPAAGTQPASTTAPTTAAASTPSGPATVKVANNATLGNILVGLNGMTLYIFTKDTPGVSNCSGGCATLWPPLLTNGTPVSGDPSITGTIGTITRSDGTQQVTINNMPLYYYSKDTAAGDTTGQNVGSVWFTVQPSGTPKQ